MIKNNLFSRPTDLRLTPLLRRLPESQASAFPHGLPFQRGWVGGLESGRSGARVVQPVRRGRGGWAGGRGLGNAPSEGRGRGWPDPAYKYSSRGAGLRRGVRGRVGAGGPWRFVKRPLVGEGVSVRVSKRPSCLFFLSPSRLGEGLGSGQRLERAPARPGERVRRAFLRPLRRSLSERLLPSFADGWWGKL